MDNFFQIEQLNYAYQKTPVLHNLNLSIQAGECVALLGPSGVGKTTLLHIIAGLLSANGGDIYLQKNILTQNGQHKVPCEKRDIGMVFQNYALFPQLNVANNIAFGMHRHHYSSTAIKDRVNQLLKLMHMDQLSQRYPHELSGGQQQRVALARALAIQPQLLLLDEPFANMDTNVRAQLHAELQRIILANKLSVLLVTHDRQEAFSLANRVGVLIPTELGAELVQLATPQEIYEKPNNITVAQLTGAVNLFPGNLVDDTVETVFGRWLCYGNNTGKGIVVTRPEQLEFTANSQGKARIVSKQFLGAKYRLLVETSIGILLIDAPLDDVNAIDMIGNITLKNKAWFIQDSIPLLSTYPR